MANIQGVVSTGNILQARRKYSTSDILWESYVDYASLAFFVRRLGKKNVTDPKFRWFEVDLPAGYVTVNNSTGYGTTDTSIVVDDASPVVAGTVLKNVATGEQMRVTASDTSTNTITVSRGWGTTAAAAISDNDVLAVVGDAHGEGASLPESVASKPVEVTNYTQIFREPVKLTETEAATDLWAAGGGDIKQRRIRALQIHKRKIEKAFLFGEPKEDLTTTSSPIRATGGVEYFISSNVTSVGGALTEATFDTWVNDAFQYGEKKLGIFSPLVARGPSYWSKQKLVTYPKDKMYGVQVRTYLASAGELPFVVEKLLKENSTWNGYAFIVDLEKAGYRYLSNNGINRDTRLRPNRQAAGDDMIAEEYLTECGLFFANEKFHSLMKGVTSIS